MIKLSAFADEAADELDRQISALKRGLFKRKSYFFVRRKQPFFLRKKGIRQRRSAYKRFLRLRFKRKQIFN